MVCAWNCQRFKKQAPVVRKKKVWSLSRPAHSEDGGCWVVCVREKVEWTKRWKQEETWSSSSNIGPWPPDPSESLTLAASEISITVTLNMECRSRFERPPGLTMRLIYSPGRTAVQYEAWNSWGSVRRSRLSGSLFMAKSTVQWTCCKTRLTLREEAKLVIRVNWMS